MTQDLLAKPSLSNVFSMMTYAKHRTHLTVLHWHAQHVLLVAQQQTRQATRVGTIVESTEHYPLRAQHCL